MESYQIDHVAMATAVEQSADAIVITSRDGNIEYVNSAFTLLTGYTSAEAMGQNPRVLKSGCHPDQFYRELWQTVVRGDVWRGQLVNRRKDGSLYDEEMQISPVRAAAGEITGYIAIKRDVTKRKIAEEAQSFLAAIVEVSEDAIIAATPAGVILTWNHGAESMFGCPAKDAIGKPVWAFISPELSPEMDKCVSQVAHGNVVSNYEGACLRSDGSSISVAVTGFPLKDAAGKVVAITAMLRDITERKRLETALRESEELLHVTTEEKIRFLAYHDALTELPNRSMLLDSLDNALAGARRRDEKVGLLLLNLDRFKTINESFGHAFGDFVLRDLAKRLKNCVREPDTVARTAGDEFVVVLNGISDAAMAMIAAERVMDAMSATFILQGHSFNIGCCIGISIFPEQGADCETLIGNADAAMTSAKDCGHGNIRFFTDEMNAKAVEQSTIEKNLRFALERDEFFLVYQPQIEISSGRVTGFEALIRWRHPELGLIPPDRFISIAERNDLILPIGEWVIKTACAQARTWQDYGLPAVSMAVNVSAVQFHQDNFCTLVRQALHQSGLSPQYLELELTEGLLLSTADITVARFHELKQMGLKLAIDDFGTGYSSLAYLRQLPVDRLKIDKAFIQNIAGHYNDAAIVTAMISLTKSLHLNVIAEGVETEAQLSFLRDHDCDEVQGFYFSKPVSAEEATSILQRNRRCPLLAAGPSTNLGAAFITASSPRVSPILLPQ
jgi:diguanylate cyclase (GGDEF)-like protein/PAS domain S-box-containing protein